MTSEGTLQARERVARMNRRFVYIVCLCAAVLIISNIAMMLSGKS